MTSDAPPPVQTLTDEQRVEVRRRLFEFFQSHLKHTVEMQGGMGKWLLASLLLVHGGIFAFVAQSDTLASAVLPSIYWWLLCGLITALLSGFATWWNWTLASRLYAAISPEMIYLDAKLPRFSFLEKLWVQLTMYSALVLGIASVGCLVGAAVCAADHLAVATSVAAPT